MSWFYLTSAVLLEVFGTMALRCSDGISKLYPSIIMAIFYILSVVAFAYAIKKMDISMAYALWSGLGTLMVASIGIFYFQESINPMKLASIALIIIGVIGLHMQSTAS